jgi:hypothetical protein
MPTVRAHNTDIDMAISDFLPQISLNLSRAHREEEGSKGVFSVFGKYPKENRLKKYFSLAKRCRFAKSSFFFSKTHGFVKYRRVLRNIPSVPFLQAGSVPCSCYFLWPRAQQGLARSLLHLGGAARDSIIRMYILPG